MADKKISQLSSATTPLAGTEVLPIVQSGSTVKASVTNVQDAPYPAGVANGLMYLNGSKVATTTNRISWDTNILKTIGSSDGAGVYIDSTSNPLKIVADDRTGSGYGTLGLYVNNGTSAVQKAAVSNTELKLPDTNLQFGTTGKGITDANNNELAKFTTTASAVNEFTVANAATGNAPTLSATGDDTNVGINISPKGTGNSVFTVGNVGLGINPATWITNWRSVEGTYLTLADRSDSNNAFFGANFKRVSGTDWTYKNTSGATMYQTGSQHIWWYAPSGTVDTAITWTEAGRFDTAGNFKATAGNVVVGTAGKGIDFSANTHAAGMTSELLNWYEEGTFTATFTAFSAAPSTPITATAYYTRVGRLVTCHILFSNVDTTGASGAMLVQGLPFTPANIRALGPVNMGGLGVTAGVAIASSGSTTIEIWDITQVNNLNIVAGSGKTLGITIAYTV